MVDFAAWMKGLAVNLNPSSFEGHDNPHRPDDAEILVDFKGVALESLLPDLASSDFFHNFSFFWNESGALEWHGYS